MTLKDYQRIRRYISRYVKPKGVKTTIAKLPDNWQGSFDWCQKVDHIGRPIGPRFRGIRLATGLRPGYTRLHAYLHECCHARACSNSEYKAESLLREICRQQGWGDILRVSTRWIKDMSAKRDKSRYTKQLRKLYYETQKHR